MVRAILFGVIVSIGFGYAIVRGQDLDRGRGDIDGQESPQRGFDLFTMALFHPALGSYDDLSILAGPDVVNEIDSPHVIPALSALTRSAVRPQNIGQSVVVSGPQVFNNSNRLLPYGLLGRSETTIAASDDGKYILVGWNDPNGFLAAYAAQGVSAFAFSNDSGETFQGPRQFPPVSVDTSTVVARGDPSSAVGGGDGTRFYFANLAALPGTLLSIGVLVDCGTVQSNGSFRWTAEHVILPPQSTDVLDKEVIVADRSAGSHMVYIAVTNFTDVPSGAEIELYRSPDDGLTWLGPTAVSDSVTAVAPQGPSLAIGPAGEVYVGWEERRSRDAAQLMFRASHDHGETFGSIQTAARITATSPYPPVGFNRIRGNDFPRIAVDQSSPLRGRVYLAYHDAGANARIHTDGFIVNTRTGTSVATGGVADGDVYLRYSDDGGATWSAPKLVSSAFPGDGKDQLWPVVSINSRGTVNVVYYEDMEVESQPIDSLATNISLGNGSRRHSMYQSLFDVRWAQSNDGGDSFQPPQQLDDEAFDCSIVACNLIPNFGDYIASIAAGGSGLIYSAWSQNVEYDIDPGPNVNERMVPAVVFVKADPAGGVIATAPPRVPEVSSLGQNYPNPFNPTTTITFKLRAVSQVNLAVYDVLGREVATLVRGQMGSGEHSVRFDGRSLASGLYYYRIDAQALASANDETLGESFVSVRKMLLLR